MVEAGNHVEIVSIYRDSGSVFFSLNAQVNVCYLVDRPMSIDLTKIEDEEGSSDDKLLADSPSRITPAAWDNQLNALTDQAAVRALSRIETDILVPTTPALTALASEYAPQHIVIVQQEHRPTGSRGATLAPVLLYGPRIDCLVSLTERSTEWLVEKFGPSAPRLETIANSIPDIFRPQTADRMPLIIAAGRFVTQKRFDHLIRAFAIVAPRNPAWRLRIYGSGPHEDLYRKVAKSLGIDGRVEMIPPVADMLAEWSRASIAALSSRNEGLPLVVLEAIAAGVPVVAYDCPTGPSEIIDDGVNGRLVPLGDVQILAEALEELMIDSDKRQAMGHAARESAQRFAPDIIQSQWINLFSELLMEAAKFPNRNLRSLERAKHATRAQRRSSTLDSPLHAATELESDCPGRDVAVPLAELNGRDVTMRNASFVEELLSNANIGYLPLKGYEINRSAIAISFDDKDRLLDAVAKSTLRGLRAEALSGSRRITPGAWEPLSTETIPPAFDSANVIRIFREFADEHGVVRRGDGYASDVEIWQPSEDPTLLAPPRHNRVLDRVEAAQFDSRQGTRARVELTYRPTGSPLPLWSDVTFPIDAVFTWVDDTDPVWVQSRQKYGQSCLSLHPEADSTARFVNRNELKYAIRAIGMFAPWIRKIFVVTADQIPDWFVQADDRVQFVSHNTLFPDSESLPTFNSHAIETVLHRIDGLSEHFLYFNDDTILGRAQRPETYFAPNGLSKFFTSPVKINYLANDMPPHIGAAANNRELLAQEFGIEISQCLLHTPYAHRKSVLEEMEAKFRQQFAETRSSRFRSNADISLLSSFAQYYSFATGRAINGKITYSYIGLGRDDTEISMAKTLRDRRSDIVTLGESNYHDPDPTLTAFVVDQFLQELVPIPSPYERD